MGELHPDSLFQDMLGDDGEATVVGIHFTDLGMMSYADLLYPVLRRVLK